MEDENSLEHDLSVLQRAGMFRISELAWWFDVPHPTISSWLHGRRSPVYPKSVEVERRLRLLKAAVGAYLKFPIPRRISFADRKAYVTAVFAELDGIIPQGVDTGPRVQMRRSDKGGKSKSILRLYGRRISGATGHRER